MNIGRVIARPFVGEQAADFERTGNRRDFSIKPPKPTLLNRVSEAGREMVAIGKIADIYAHEGPTKVVKASGNAALGEATMAEMKTLPDGALLMTNFVDFDMLYGHRRDVTGYANALEQYDLWLAGFINEMRKGDLLVITADHGCDPTWEGTDHTREQVPVLMYSKGIVPGGCGTRDNFCDTGETVAHHLGLARGECGQGMLQVAS